MNTCPDTGESAHTCMCTRCVPVYDVEFFGVDADVHWQRMDGTTIAHYVRYERENTLALAES